ncbi:hypothetical protein GCM10010503_63750 [Streptomyces lucensis JCM 4490]|uniref:Uncharacterized protein n=1 Tax=Streptomyces lucensis JCM 4490 TaxID=1306176 RepID=A0A918JES0_9ACTN|nr:hypothetical protein GCM10010503_63750 [Streptomyces lucensis JCM 4490]
MAGFVALLVVVAAAAAARWTREEDADPLAGRPRVTDTRAGLTYGVPEGWRHDPVKDKGLIDAFTSQITSRTHGASTTSGGTVVAGPAGRPVPRADLRRTTESAARSNAGFFFPDRPATLEESRATLVDGRPAHTAVLRVPGDDGGARLEMTLVNVDGGHTSFLLGLVSGEPDAALTADLHDVVASTAVA